MRMVPLRRNRDFVLLETGRLLSGAGTQLTTIAYPLLLLALTHSPASAAQSIVGSYRVVAASKGGRVSFACND